MTDSGACDRPPGRSAIALFGSGSVCAFSQHPSDILNHRSAAYFLPEPAHKAVAFPKITPHAPNTKQTPARKDLSFIDRIGQSIWALGARLRENDLKYAIKAGMATAMLAAPAFFDRTRPIFVEYRGEWALISVTALSFNVVTPS